MSTDRDAELHGVVQNAGSCFSSTCVLNGKRRYTVDGFRGGCHCFLTVQLFGLCLWSVPSFVCVFEVWKKTKL